VETDVAVGCIVVNGVVVLDGGVVSDAADVDSAVASTYYSALRCTSVGMIRDLVDDNKPTKKGLLCKTLESSIKLNAVCKVA
jgi:hypothetical protein